MTKTTQHLTHLESTGLLRLAQTHPELEYLFRHALVQDAAYESLLLADRRQLHRQVAETLERLYPDRLDELSGQLVNHFATAGEPDKAIAYARQAARQAQRHYAYQEAIGYLQTGLELLEADEPMEMRLVLLEELADAHRLLTKDYQAITLYQAALKQWSSLADADGMIAVRLHRKILEPASTRQAHLGVNRYAALSQTWAESRAYLEARVSQAEREPPQLEMVKMLTTLANDTDERFPADLDTTERYAQAAVNMAEQLDTPAELSAALGALAKVYFARGLLSEHLEISRRRLALSRDPRFGDLREQINILDGLSNALIQAGEYAQALSYLLEEESLAKQIKAVGLEAWVLNAQALCWYRLDRWDEIFKLDEKRRNLEQRYTREELGITCLEIAISAAVQALRGDFDQARVLRELAYDIMLRTSSGESTENWGRTHHY